MMQRAQVQVVKTIGGSSSQLTLSRNALPTTMRSTSQIRFLHFNKSRNADFASKTRLSQRVTTSPTTTATMTTTTRHYSSNSDIRKSIRNIPLIAVGLILGGLTITAVGLFKFYTSGVNAFPEDIRNDLRKALYYQNYGEDPIKAVGFYQSALSAAMQHPDLKIDGPEVTGIMIQLGTLLEDLKRVPEAIDVLGMAFECLVHGQAPGVRIEDPVLKKNAEEEKKAGESEFDGLQHHPDDKSQPDSEQDSHHQHRILDGPTRLKAIGIAQKLGDLYHSLKKDDMAERYYLWSVEQLLKNHDSVKASSNNEHQRSAELIKDTETIKSQFNFDKPPAWMTKTDLGASLEALAGFYSAKGVYSNALPLYMRALALVDQTSCHASVLMCNISDVFAGMGNLQEATGWAERGLRTGQAGSGRECDESCGVILYNLGMLHEMKGSPIKALEFYKKSKLHGQQTGFRDCIQESDKALKRLQAGNEGR